MRESRDDNADGQKQSTFRRASSMIDMTPQTEEEMQAIRDAVVTSEGLLLSVFDVLRRVPRRVLMVLKLNDLTRCDLCVEPLTCPHSRINSSQES
jgi:aarF domain-containing kinase